MRSFCLVVVCLFTVLNGRLSAQSYEEVVLPHYDNRMLYLPTAGTIYNDSVYLEHIGGMLPFNFDTYYRRFAAEGREVMVDETFYFFHDILLNMPKAQAMYELDRMSKVASQRKNNQLEYEAEFWRTIFLLRETPLPPEKILDHLQPLIEQADKRGELSLKYRGILFLLDDLWDPIHPDYTLYFTNVLTYLEEVEQAPEKAFIGKRGICLSLGNAYYQFQVYDRAVYYLKQALSPNSRFFYDATNMKSLDLLADLYASTGVADSAAYYALATLNSHDIVKDRPVYDAKAILHLGFAATIQHQYGTAIRLMQEGMPVIRAEKDYPLLARAYIHLGECYLGQGNVTKASLMADSAKYYVDTYQCKQELHLLHTLTSHLYTQKGEEALSAAASYAAIDAKIKAQEPYDPVFILKAEQNLADNKTTFTGSPEWDFRLFLIGGVGLLFVIGIIIGVVILKKRKATGTNDATSSRPLSGTYDTMMIPDTEADPGDIMVMDSIREMVVDEQLFRNPALNVKLLADQMGITPQMVIKAINRIENKTFAKYVNKLRAQEAIHVISDNPSGGISFDQMAISCGYYDRKSFFREFKHETGITPSDFQKKQKQ